MFDVLNSMQNQVKNLQQMQLELMLEKCDLKFKSMPSLEVSSKLDFSSLIEQVGKNATEAGTILQSNGSPVAVIFSTEQYKLVDGIVKFIPAVIQNMHDALKNRIEFKEKFQELSVKILNTTGSLLHATPALILIGTIATSVGAFFLGKKFHEVENNQTKLKSRMSYIMPSVILAAGIGVLALTISGTNNAGTACFELAKTFSTISE